MGNILCGLGGPSVTTQSPKERGEQGEKSESVTGAGSLSAVVALDHEEKDHKSMNAGSLWILRKTR